MTEPMSRLDTPQFERVQSFTFVPIPATRIGPSEYALATDRIERGNEFTAHGNTFRVVGEPITVGWHAVEVRVREVGGHHDGNEFSAHLHT